MARKEPEVTKSELNRDALSKGTGRLGRHTLVDFRRMVRLGMTGISRGPNLASPRTAAQQPGIQGFQMRRFGLWAHRHGLANAASKLTGDYAHENQNCQQDEDRADDAA